MNLKKILTLVVSTLVVLVLLLGTGVVPASGAMLRDNIGNPIPFESPSSENVQPAPNSDTPCSQENADAAKVDEIIASEQGELKAMGGCAGIRSSDCGTCDAGGFTGRCMNYQCIAC
jgi:hypothetical protein